MSKIKNGGLDYYGAEPFKQQQFGTAGVEVVNKQLTYLDAEMYRQKMLQLKHSRVGQLDFDFWKVFIECFKSHLILMLQSFVQLTVPVCLPRLHVLNSKTLDTISTTYTTLS